MGNLYSSPSVDLKVEVTKDKNLLGKLVAHEDISCAFKPEKGFENYADNLGKNHICYLLKAGEAIAGIAVLFCIGDMILEPVTYVADIGYFKEFRGKIALELAAKAIEDFYKSHLCTRLMAVIERDKKETFFFAKWLGFNVISKSSNKYFMRYSEDG